MKRLELIFLAGICLCSTLYAEQAAINAVDPSTIPLAIDPSLYGSVLAGSENINEFTGNFNPTVDVLQTMLALSPDEKSNIQGIGKELRIARNEASKQEDRSDKKVWGKYREKSATVEKVLSGKKRDRLVDIFSARKVYSIPRIATRDEVRLFENKLQQYSSQLGKQLALPKDRVDRIYPILREYYLHTGHLIKDIDLFQNYIDKNNPTEKDIAKLREFVNQAKDIRETARKDFNSFLNKEQMQTIEDWMAWPQPQ